ncbi:uncharacterized protein LOC136716137 [Amia ocellicauda]|uniref:uncharacterized protein LOC136716137 n=1 Tax=Amia ocellicauda TaxID=2972642 RepID=UPI003463DAE6
MHHSYLPAYHTFNGMFATVNAHRQWPPIQAAGSNTNGHFLPPIYPQRPVTLVWEAPQLGAPVEYHHFYGINPLSLLNPYWYWPYARPPHNNWGYGARRSEQQSSGAWPEGFTMKGELRWGKLERVYGQRKELPEFVKEDLRRVYGTYPRTDVSVTYQGGEYVVRGDPRVGDQEYKVEKKVVRQVESPEGDSVSEIVEKKKKKKKSK